MMLRYKFYPLIFLAFVSFAGCVTPEGPKSGIVFVPHMVAYENHFSSSKEIRLVSIGEEKNLSLEKGYINIGSMTIRHDKKICWKNEECKMVKQPRPLKNDLLSSAKEKGATVAVLSPITADNRAISKKGKCTRSRLVQKYNVICTGGQSTYGSSTMGSSGVFKTCINQPYYTRVCIEREVIGGNAYSENLTGTLYRYDPKMAMLETNNNLYVTAIKSGNLSEIKRFLSMGFPSNNTLLDGTLPVCAAASSGQIKSIETLLKSGAFPSSVDSTGKSPLMYALLSKNYEMAKLLIGNNCEVIQCDGDGKTVVEYSLNAGEKFTKTIMSSKQMKFDGSKQKSGENEVRAALLNRSPELSKQLINMGAKLPKLDIPFVQEVLVSADVETAKYILSLKPKCFEPRNIAKFSHEAQDMYRSIGSNQKVFKLITAIQIPLDKVTSFSPLMVASGKGDIDTVKKLILEGVNVNKTAWGYDKALNQAASGNATFYETGDRYIEVVRALVEAGADVNYVDRWHGNALKDAITFRRDDIAEYLLEKGADPNIKLSDGTRSSHYPILKSAERCNAEQIKLLLRHGADVNRVSFHKKTAIDEAKKAMKYWSNEEWDKKCEETINVLKTAGLKD